MNAVAQRHANQKAEAVPAAREALRARLVELADLDPRICCLDSDVGGLDQAFGAKHPERYFDVGIAEANLMSVAAGMAHVGLMPFVHSMAAFASARACEQIKLDICYPQLPVRIVASHAAYSAGHLGPTHHAAEDVAIVRALPHIGIFVPSDDREAAAAIDIAQSLPGPLYIRLGRKPTPRFEWSATSPVFGQARLLRDGSDITLMASGPNAIVAAEHAASTLLAKGIEAKLLVFATIRPFDEAAVVAAARQTAGIVTIEEHSIVGGLGTAVAEVVAERHPCPVRRIGFSPGFVEIVGSESDLLALANVTAESVVQAALALLEFA